MNHQDRTGFHYALDCRHGEGKYHYETALNFDAMRNKLSLNISVDEAQIENVSDDAAQKIQAKLEECADFIKAVLNGHRNSKWG